MTTLAQLSATEAAARIGRGELKSEELVRSYLERIEAIEPQVQAWQHLDQDYALGQARHADSLRQRGAPTGPLHGVPVGIKDIIDTADQPTENGTPLYAGRRPDQDARVVALLRQAGAIILGKTVTTELAVYTPGKTRNPHNPEHTPGGSSSGSAAAVSAGMVPLAVGTQTNGSVIRPAAFCGIHGFKPSHGLIPRSGILCQSIPLDQVGGFARSVEDVALLCETMMDFDPGDPDSRPRARPRLAEAARSAPPVELRFAFVRSPVWDQAEEDTKEAFGELVDFLGERCEAVELPELFDKAVEWHTTILLADLAKSFAPEYARGREILSEKLVGLIEQGQRCLAVDYNQALDWRKVLNRGLAEVFERFDAILTPATPGEAPHGLDTTGNPIFCSLWTLCGTPAINLPLLQGSHGLPIGVQLVGARGDDARLLRTANWLAQHVEAAAQLAGEGASESVTG
jgi:Asp-tRNA(Asn)/Glu-tRNA(Gln) amidotransferase A subunit family amidase